jgi:endonuclease YncB( thermonuclease family)
VTEVIDGDTIRVRAGGEVKTVRLVGIDAPERGHPRKPREFLADEAAAALASLCGGKDVRLERDLEDADRHGRLLRYAFTADGGTLLNRELVRRGMARVYRRFPFSRLAEFEEAESQARREGAGLWSGLGLDELKWVRNEGREPVEVWPVGGGAFGIAHGGVGKSGIGAKDLGAEIGKLAGLRNTLSPGEYAAAAALEGYGPVVARGPLPPAGAPPSSREAEPPRAARPPEADPDFVPWDRAGERVGRRVAVEGAVVRAKRSRKAVFLNFHPNWERYLTIVLLPGRLPGLPASPEKALLGRRIRVRGTVRLYKDRPEIVVESPSDLAILP